MTVALDIGAILVLKLGAEIGANRGGVNRNSMLCRFRSGSQSRTDGAMREEVGVRVQSYGIAVVLLASSAPTWTAQI